MVGKQLDRVDGKPVLTKPCEFSWDLPPGDYELKAANLDKDMKPVTSFSKKYQAKAGKTYVWPLKEAGAVP
jgi:hypothetical protein